MSSTMFVIKTLKTDSVEPLPIFFVFGKTNFDLTVIFDDL